MVESAPKFESRKDIEGWLNRQTREAVVVFAARAALRAVPALVGLTTSKRVASASALILPTFRAMAAP